MTFLGRKSVDPPINHLYVTGHESYQIHATTVYCMSCMQRRHLINMPKSNICFLVWQPIIGYMPNHRTTDAQFTTLEPSSSPTRQPTDGHRPSTLVSHCQHSGLLRELGLQFYTRSTLSTLWPRSMIAIGSWWCHDHRSLVKWSRQAILMSRQSMTLEVVHWHEKLEPESGVEFTPMTPISGASFWSVCQVP